uniref:Uncharacterized protein n=1 Tax=Arundo donax TaxID=35708 RepID=A0A0A8YRZ2_ARUDO
MRAKSQLNLTVREKMQLPLLI